MARKSPYTTTSKPTRGSAIAETFPVNREIDDIPDDDSTLTLLVPEEEAVLQGSDGDSVVDAYFKLNLDDDSAWADGAPHAVRVSIHYLDIGSGEITVKFSTDGSTAGGSKHVADLADTGEWKWVTKRLLNIWFGHTVYAAFGDADFRVNSDTDPLFIDAVIVREVSANLKASWIGDEFERVVVEQEDGDITLDEGVDIAVGTVTGSKIATAPDQLLGFWGNSPVAQPDTSVAAATFVANSGTTVKDDSTFDGYTMGQIVTALRLAGILD